MGLGLGLYISLNIIKTTWYHYGCRKSNFVEKTLAGEEVGKDQPFTFHSHESLKYRQTPFHKLSYNGKQTRYTVGKQAKTFCATASLRQIIREYLRWFCK